MNEDEDKNNRDKELETEMDMYLHKNYINKVIKILVIVLNIIFLAIFIFSLPYILLIGIMDLIRLFFGLGTGTLWEVAMASYGFVVLISIIVSSILSFGFKSYKKALICSLLPLINVVIIVWNF